MERKDNYAIQAQLARERFLHYDQQALIDKLKLKYDPEHLYTAMLGEPYRIHRITGDIQRYFRESWVDANSFGETLTLLDLVCDSRQDRYIASRWKNMNAFGLMFHTNLLETARDPWAERFEQNPEDFRKACEALGGVPFPNGDIAYVIEVFDGLPLVIQLWFGDEEFPAGLRFLWDENALMYIKYETMHYAKGLLLQRLAEKMNVGRGHDPAGQ